MENEAFLSKAKEEANAIMAEIVRLASFVPQEFINPNSSEFKPLIMGFDYFARAPYYEKLIEGREDLQDDFYNRNGDILSQFSTLFQTLATFLCSLKEYIDQVANERIGRSYLDVVDMEILFHIGLVLLYFEKFLPSAVAERIYVAVYRNRRLKINESFVDKCLSCCENIYKEGVNDFVKLHVDKNLLSKWMFVFLLFKPAIMKTEAVKMRKIVEDFFRDDWVLQLGLGLNVNLIEKWQHYRAALTAITSKVDVKKAKQLALDHYNTLEKLTIPQV
ncbi:hypothetical protein DICVIV_12636 [Dictyocaulus viviparus]|uniref:Uncharacterized protein n=1 Tax=Dictyocaulus viviparus TaxID=29172 RepID=A0A0D8XG88_DICVI|nr:hypothetical protein DICVIV_12636 [Dictyocaulus viviparus]